MESKRKELQNQVDCLCELRRETGMTRKAFSEYMDIPHPYGLIFVVPSDSAGNT